MSQKKRKKQHSNYTGKDPMKLQQTSKNKKADRRCGQAVKNPDFSTIFFFHCNLQILIILYSIICCV